MGGRLPNGTAHDSHRETTLNTGPKTKGDQDQKTLERQRYPTAISSKSTFQCQGNAIMSFVLDAP